MYVTFLYKKMHNVKNELWAVLIFSWAKSVQKPSFAISKKALTRRPVFAIKWLDYFELKQAFLMQNVQKLNALKYATVFLSGGKKGGGGLNVR